MQFLYHLQYSDLKANEHNDVGLALLWLVRLHPGVNQLHQLLQLSSFRNQFKPMKTHASEKSAI